MKWLSTRSITLPWRPARPRDALAQGSLAGIGLLVLWAAILCFGGMLTWLSIARYAGYNAPLLDMGRMVQAIASGARGEPLFNTSLTSIEGVPTSRLAEHFELIYLLIFVPLYTLWSDPRLLLIIQAGLFALGALPVYRLTLRRTAQPLLACGMAIVYLSLPAAQTSVLFDLHGDTLAMPLLVFALDALDARRWRQYALFIILALFCKFYVVIPVAGIGLYALLWGGQRRAGLLTIAAAGVYGAVVIFGIRPLFHAENASGTEISQSYVEFYFGQIFTEVPRTLGDRFRHAALVFGPVALLIGVGWRWLLPALPIAAAVLLSTGPGPVYDIEYHHYALVVPFLMMAAIDGLGRINHLNQRRQQRGQRVFVPLGTLVVATLLMTQAANSRVVETPLSPSFWSGAPHTGLHPWRYGVTSRDEMKNRFLARHIPPEAPLAASRNIAPHVSDRATIYATRYFQDAGVALPQSLPHVDYVLADALYDWILGIDFETEQIAYLLAQPDFGLVQAQDGLLLFARDAPSEQVLTQQIQVDRPTAAPPVQATFGETIGLVEAQITPRDDGRFRAEFAWLATAPPDEAYVAVSRLRGVDDARIVHLPSYVLEPTTTWQAGQVVQETFDVALPADLPAGSYTWEVGWYLVEHPDSFTTDERTLLPGSTVVDVAQIEVMHED